MERNDQDYILDTNKEFLALNLNATGVELIPKDRNAGGFPVNIYVDDSTQPLTVDARGVIRHPVPINRIRVNAAAGGGKKGDVWTVRLAPTDKDIQERRARHDRLGNLYTRPAEGRLLWCADTNEGADFSYWDITFTESYNFLDPVSFGGYMSGIYHQSVWNMGAFRGLTFSIFSDEDTGPNSALLSKLFLAVQIVDTDRYKVTTQPAVIRSFVCGSANNLVGAPPRTALTIEMGTHAGATYVQPYATGTTNWGTFMRFAFVYQGNLAEYGPGASQKHLRISLSAT